MIWKNPNKNYKTAKDLPIKMNPALNLLLGLSTADALGVPVEFCSREELYANPVTDMRAFGTHSQEAGTWSDDSSMSFCLAENIANGFDIHALAEAFVNWLYYNYWTANNEVFDAGNTCYRAISRLKDNCSPYESGETEDYNNGNGALMRIAPLALYTFNMPPQQRVDTCLAVAGITHKHPRSQVACIYYNEFLIGLLGKTAPAEIYQQLRQNFQPLIAEHYQDGLSEMQHFDRLLNNDIQNLSIHQIRSSGYVIDNLEASIWCLLNNKTYSETVLKAVNLGLDTDTTAAVVGALAGVLYGEETIPEPWLKVLKRQEDIIQLAERLQAACPI